MHGAQSLPDRGHRDPGLGLPPGVDRIPAGQRGSDDPRPGLVAALAKELRHRGEGRRPRQPGRLFAQVDTASRRRPFHETAIRVGADFVGEPAHLVLPHQARHPACGHRAHVLGFGRDRVIRVRVDSQGRMLASRIPNLRGPVIICAQLGNVNTGACDPIDDICAIAQSAGAWVHVDGAFGLWAATAPARRYLVEGLAAADSWATDGHKWLNTPQDCGIAIVRDREALRRAMAISAAYYGPLSKREPMQWCPDSSRRARAVELWAALRFLGKNGVAEMVERTCRLASQFAKNLSNAGFEVLNEVELNQVLVAFGTDEETERVIEAVQEDGTCWCAGTIWKGRRAMRISVSSWATSSEDVDLSSDAIRRLAEQVLVGTGS